MNEKFLSHGKRKDNGEWVTGYYVKLPEHHIIFDLDGDVDYIIPETVGHCTGLTGKNGTRIFEGDILRYGGNNMKLSLNRGIVLHISVLYIPQQKQLHSLITLI